MRISDWSTDVCSSDLSAKARDAATKGKDKAAEAVGSLAKMLEDSAGTVDTKFGKQYGDYERSAASTVAGLASTPDQKDSSEERRVGKEVVSTCKSRGSPQY